MSSLEIEDDATEQSHLCVLSSCYGAWCMLALSKIYRWYVVQSCICFLGLVWIQNRRPKAEVS